MLVHIANFYDTERFSATAGEAMAVGAVVSVENDLAGGRKLMKVDNANDLVAGKYGIAYKVSTDAMAVSKSTAPAKLGDRTTTIANGDQIVWVLPGAIVEYDVSTLDASLDPARAGALPAVGDRLGVKASLFSTLGAAGAIITPMVARVVEVFGTKIRVLITVPTV